MFSLQVRQTRVAALVGVFGGSAMLWVICTSGCYAFVFQQPIGIGPETRLARGPDCSSAGQKGPLGTRLFEDTKPSKWNHGSTMVIR